LTQGEKLGLRRKTVIKKKKLDLSELSGGNEDPVFHHVHGEGLLLEGNYRGYHPGVLATTQQRQ
jgi:hypothetical protein